MPGIHCVRSRTTFSSSLIPWEELVFSAIPILLTKEVQPTSWSLAQGEAEVADGTLQNRHCQSPSWPALQQQLGDVTRYSYNIFLHCVSYFDMHATTRCHGNGDTAILGKKLCQLSKHPDIHYCAQHIRKYSNHKRKRKYQTQDKQIIRMQTTNDRSKFRAGICRFLKNKLEPPDIAAVVQASGMSTRESNMLYDPAWPFENQKQRQYLPMSGLVLGQPEKSGRRPTH